MVKLKEKFSKNISLTEGSIFEGLIIFSIPLILTNFLQQLYNTADLMIVGRFAGKNPMAAVGATGPLSTLLVGLFLGLTTGAGVIISTYYGMNDAKKLRDSVTCAYFLAILSGLIITVGGILTTPLLLRLLGTPDEIMTDAINYMRIFYLGATPLIIYNMGASISIATGDSKRPFNFLLVAALVNIVLDFVFVGYFKMSVIGAGIATFSAQAVSAILVTLNLTNSDSAFRLRIKKISYHKEIAKQIFLIGIPTGLQSSFISFTNVVIQAKINSFGSNVIAGISAEGRIDGFVFMTLQAVALAATTYAGQNFGAKRIDRIKEGVKVTVNITLAIALVLSLISIVFANQLIAAFNPNEEVVFYGAKMLRIICLAVWAFGLSESLSAFIRGSGEALAPMLISFVWLCISRIAFIYLPIKGWSESIDPLCWSYPFSYICNFIVTYIYYKFGKWRKKASL